MTLPGTPRIAWYRSVTVLIVAGCLVAIVNFSIRSAFGFFTVPVSEAHGWPREIIAHQPQHRGVLRLCRCESCKPLALIHRSCQHS